VPHPGDRRTYGSPQPGHDRPPLIAA
jgi:hypothetical protein